MKKLLVITLIAAALLTSCGGEKKDKTNTQNSQSNVSAEITSNYTVDFATVCSDENLAAVKEYFKSAQPGISEEDLDKQINENASFVKAVNNLKLDTKKHFEETLIAMGGDASIESAKASGLTESYINFVLAIQTSSAVIADYMEENNLFSTEDAKKYFNDNYWRAKHVLLQTEGKTDEEKAELKKQAEDILARAKAGEDFHAMVQELSEDPGSKSQPDGYVFTTGTMVKEFEDGTKNTPIGEFTLVETSYGYHVIQRLAIDETPELYEKFYSESNVENDIKSKQMLEFALKNSQ